MRQSHDPSTKTPSKPATDARSRSWYRRYPVAIFLIALVFTIVAAPFEERFRNGDLLEAVLLTVVLLSAVIGLGRSRKTLTRALVIIVIALVGKWGNHLRPDLMPAAIYLVATFLFFMLVEVHLLRYMLRARRVNSEVLCASVAGYLILGLLWTSTYVLADGIAPGSFAFSDGSSAVRSMKGFTAIYFSYCTICTLGCGDITPVSNATRTLAMTEAMFGTLYMAILVARFVSLYSAAPAPSAVEAIHDGTESDDELHS